MSDSLHDQVRSQVERELKINAIPIAWLIIRTISSRFIPGKLRAFWQAFQIKRLA